MNYGCGLISCAVIVLTIGRLKLTRFDQYYCYYYTLLVDRIAIAQLHDYTKKNLCVNMLVKCGNQLTVATPAAAVAPAPAPPAAAATALAAAETAPAAAEAVAINAHALILLNDKRFSSCQFASV